MLAPRLGLSNPLHSRCSNRRPIRHKVHLSVSPLVAVASHRSILGAISLLSRPFALHAGRLTAPRTLVELAHLQEAITRNHMQGRHPSTMVQA